MNKFNLFGRKITIKVEGKSEKERSLYKISPVEVISEKLNYLILFLILIVLSSKVFLIDEVMTKGEISRKDIISPRTISFRDDYAKQKIREGIKGAAKKTYITVSDANKLSEERIDSFFDAIITLKMTNSVTTINEFRRNYDFSLKGSTLEKLMLMSDLELLEYKEEIKKLSEELYKVGVREEGSTLLLKEAIGRYEKEQKGNENEIFITQDMEEILSVVISPNLILDDETSRSVLEERLAQVKDVITTVEAGDVIIKKGTAVTEAQLRILMKLGLSNVSSGIVLFLGNLFYLLFLGGLLKKILKRFAIKEIGNRNIYRATFLILVVTAITYRFTVGKTLLFYFLPVETVFLLLGILVNEKFTLIISTFTLFFMLPLADIVSPSYVVYFFSLGISIYTVKTIKNRTTLMNVGVSLGVLKASIAIILALILRDELAFTAKTVAGYLISGILSGMLTIAILPFFERTFNLLTDIKLLELGDLSHPLLRELSVNAPGTFHHSMLVATLSENAAEAIGANALFARVATYYHDVGKMKRPNFYVENQSSGINPHNFLTPTLSTLIIKAHTRDGNEMGKKHKIPKEIRDIMFEHQGTTLLAYFYNKAKKSDPSVVETDFRYSGPKPRTKESAIILLADSVEAAVRSLDEKTPVTIENMLRKIISAKIDDGQLSEADLTFREIEVIIKSFTKTLMAIHHVRIKYPGQKN